ncbi:MAG: M56 family metallopeptidase [Acidobacteriota bacterium]|nr:M56 family metallopeptidase [Acidobacteriota bacterium]
MTDLLLQGAASNVLLALALAALAWGVQANGRRPALAHLLWLLVLVKLVTPPLFTVPLVALPGLSPAPAETLALPATSAALAAPGLGDGIAGKLLDVPAWASSPLTAVTGWWAASGKQQLLLLWFLGSACVLVVSLARVARFQSLLERASEPAPPDVQRLASDLARRLGLNTTPTVLTTSANLSPLVWWIGGRIRVVLPSALPHEMTPGQLRWILAHELAHVRRHDHLVRWLEWLVCASVWWNPLAWWARRGLRSNEELCCDALVLKSLKPDPRAYASSLLTVVEFLSSPPLRPPATASAMNGGLLERRFKMIVSARSLPRTPLWLKVLVLVCAAALLPLGVASAGDRDRDSETIYAHFNRLGISDEKVARITHHLQEKGLTDEQIEPTMGGLLRAVHGVQAEGERYELDPRLRDHLWQIGLTDEQIGLVDGLARRIVLGLERRAEGDDDGHRAHFRKLGVGPEIVDKIHYHLQESGFTGEQAEVAMSGILKTAYAMKKEGESYAMDPRIREYLVGEGGLTDGQVEMVQGLASRVLHGMREHGEGDGHGENHGDEGDRDRGLEGHYERMGVGEEGFEKIRDHFVESGVLEEQLEGVMGGLLRVVHGMKEQGESYEMDPRLREFFESRVGLTDEQIGDVEGIARRVLDRLKERGQG